MTVTSDAQAGGAAAGGGAAGGGGKKGDKAGAQSPEMLSSLQHKGYLKARDTRRATARTFLEKKPAILALFQRLQGIAEAAKQGGRQSDLRAFGLVDVADPSVFRKEVYGIKKDMEAEEAKKKKAEEEAAKAKAAASGGAAASSADAAPATGGAAAAPATGKYRAEQAAPKAPVGTLIPCPVSTITTTGPVCPPADRLWPGDAVQAVNQRLHAELARTAGEWSTEVPVIVAKIKADVPVGKRQSIDAALAAYRELLAMQVDELAPAPASAADGAAATPTSPPAPVLVRDWLDSDGGIMLVPSSFVPIGDIKAFQPGVEQQLVYGRPYASPEGAKAILVDERVPILWDELLDCKIPIYAKPVGTDEATREIVRLNANMLTPDFVLEVASKGVAFDFIPATVPGAQASAPTAVTGGGAAGGAAAAAKPAAAAQLAGVPSIALNEATFTDLATALTAAEAAPKTVEEKLGRGPLLLGYIRPFSPAEIESARKAMHVASALHRLHIAAEVYRPLLQKAADYRSNMDVHLIDKPAAAVVLRGGQQDKLASFLVAGVGKRTQGIPKVPGLEYDAQQNVTQYDMKLFEQLKGADALVFPVRKPFREDFDASLNKVPRVPDFDLLATNAMAYVANTDLLKAAPKKPDEFAAAFTLPVQDVAAWLFDTRMRAWWAMRDQAQFALQTAAFMVGHTLAVQAKVAEFNKRFGELTDAAAREKLRASVEEADKMLKLVKAELNPASLISGLANVTLTDKDNNVNQTSMMRFLPIPPLVLNEEKKPIKTEVRTCAIEALVPVTKTCAALLPTSIMASVPDPARPVFEARRQVTVPAGEYVVWSVGANWRTPSEALQWERLSVALAETYKAAVTAHVQLSKVPATQRALLPQQQGGGGASAASGSNELPATPSAGSM